MLVVANTATGESRTYVETKPLRLVNGGRELIFWSERDGWGHSYLYDTATGALKNRITEGEFVATAIERVDDAARVLYFSAYGRETGEDPYYTHLYRIGLDGAGLELLNPSNATHAVSVSESAKFFVNNASRRRRARGAALRHPRQSAAEARDARSGAAARGWGSSSPSRSPSKPTTASPICMG